MAFYEGIDEEIYEGGDHYVPMAKFRLNKSYTPTTVTPDVVPYTASTSYGIPTLYPYGGGGDGGYQGGGKWGNLDLSKTKTFNKQVWEVGGPANQYGGWVDKEVTGFYNPKLGNWQTFEGKNINHLGIEVPTIAGMLFDKSWGKGPQPGDIKGTFTDGWDSGIENIKEGWDEEKDKWSETFGIDKVKTFFKKKKDQEDFISTAVDTEENQPGDGGTIITPPDQSGGKGGGDGGGGHVKTPGSYDTDTSTGGSGDHRTASTSSSSSNKRRHHALADGGRIYLNLGGLANILGRTGFANGGPGFYSQVDQDIYEGGSQYVPMEQFRTSPFDYNQLKNISYDSVPINEGIVSTLGKPPIINVGGEGEGRDDDDDETTDKGGWYDEYGNMKDNFSFTDLGAFVTNPLGFMAYKSYPTIKAAIQKKQFEKDLQNPDFRDMVTENAAAGTGGHQAGWDGDFMGGPEGAGHGNAPDDKGGSDTMGSH